MNATSSVPSTQLGDIKRIGTGIAFILCPLLFVFAFSVHPGLRTPHRLSDVELILRAHDNALLAFGHVLVLFDAALLIVVVLGLMRMLDGTPAAWAGLVGASLAVLGCVAMAAEKGAECLTISALDTLPEAQFTEMMPGLVAIFSHRGWMILVMGVILLAVGLTFQAAGLFATNVVPRWQSALLLGVWLMGFPDGWEIVSLLGSILLAISLIPMGIHSIRVKSGGGDRFSVGDGGRNAGGQEA
jgi:hypothetical protein